MMEGMYMVGSVAFNNCQNKGLSDQGAVGPARKSAFGRALDVVKQLAVSKKIAQTSSQSVAARGIKRLDEVKPAPTSSEHFRQGGECFLSESIKLVAEEVRNNNSVIYKQDKESYRFAVDYLLHALSQATLGDITSRSSESAFTGNLRVDTRYQPLYELLENKNPFHASALSEGMFDIREFVYFLNKQDQEEIYKILMNKLKDPSETIPE